MIQAATTTISTLPAMLGLAGSGGDTGAGGEAFSQAIAGLLGGGLPPAGNAPDEADTDGGLDTDDRQDAAPDGTALPPRDADPAFAWLTPVLLTPPPVATASGGSGTLTNAAPMRPQAMLLDPGMTRGVTPTESLETDGVRAASGSSSSTMEADVARDRQTDTPAAAPPVTAALLGSTSLSPPATRITPEPGVDEAAVISMPVETVETMPSPRTDVVSTLGNRLQALGDEAAKPRSVAANIGQEKSVEQGGVGQPVSTRMSAAALTPVGLERAPAVQLASVAPSNSPVIPTEISPAAEAPDTPISVVPTSQRRERAASPVAPLAVNLAPVATPAQPIAGTTAPAFQIFGAMHAAVKTRDDASAGPLVTTATTAVTPVELRHSVAATGDAQQAPLDMTDARWPHTMIDRIEMLRDAADATDTRMRLIPDALGSIDVSVKRDGDTLHVHFAAEQAATRTLIHDAQPRLAAIAQERGLTLGQSAVDAGAHQNQQQGRAQQRQPEPRFSPAPTSAPTDDSDPAATGRLA